MTLTPRMRTLGYSAKDYAGFGPICPPLATIPAGSFLMGSDPLRDPRARSDEMPQHQVVLAEYQIAKYPVTVAEYEVAVRAGAVPAPEGFRKITWQFQLSEPEHPVVMITREKAIAYTQWLSSTTGIAWRLPTEAEWEKAARGSDGRIWPWGNEWDQARANTWYDGKPDWVSPVGSYPVGASPYGVEDMAGNVKQFCSSGRWEYPYDAQDGREDPRPVGWRVIRGGCWSEKAETVSRSAQRMTQEGLQGGLETNLGFRLAHS